MILLMSSNSNVRKESLAILKMLTKCKINQERQVKMPVLEIKQFYSKFGFLYPDSVFLKKDAESDKIDVINDDSCNKFIGMLLKDKDKIQNNNVGFIYFLLVLE
jgi:hypothetical protein